MYTIALKGMSRFVEKHSNDVAWVDPMNRKDDEDFLLTDSLNVGPKISRLVQHFKTLQVFLLLGCTSFSIRLVTK